MKELNMPNEIAFIKGYIPPSTVFVRNNFKFDDYEIIKRHSYRGNYIIRGINAESDYDLMDYFDMAKCFEDLDVFNSILTLGNKLMDKLSANILKRTYDRSILQFTVPKYMFFYNLFPDDIQAITPILLEWLKQNGLPFHYRIDAEGKWAELGLESFVDIVITIYIIYTTVYLMKEKKLNYNLPAKQEKQYNYLYSLLKKRIGMFSNLNGVLSWICKIENSFEEINFNYNEEFEIYKTKDEHTEYRLVKYYHNIIGVAWHKMKLLLCQNQEEKQTFIRCSICGLVENVPNANQKYCNNCQSMKQRDKYKTRYHKILNLHNQLIIEYNKRQINDKEIYQVIQLTKHSEIKKIGVKKLEELINRLENMHSL